MDRKAMYKLSYGLFILTAKEAAKDNGCIINTAIQAASEPNQLLSSSHSEAAARKTRFLLLKLWHIQRIRLSRTILWSHTGLNMI